MITVEESTKINIVFKAVRCLADLAVIFGEARCYLSIGRDLLILGELLAIPPASIVYRIQFRETFQTFPSPPSSP